MDNIYKKGRRKEYAIVEKYKKLGFGIVQRTAGSHSCVDVIAVDIKNKVIKLIQSKRSLNKTMGDIDIKLKGKIEEEHKELNGEFNVEFIAL